MLTLGVDIGFRNCGLCVASVSAGSAEVAWSTNLHVGDSDHPQHYSRTLVPYLNRIYDEFHFEALGAETPPFIQQQIKTTALLHRVFGHIECWAYERGLPIKYIPPTGIKAAARELTGCADPKENSKRLIRLAVEQLVGGKARRTNHENDAVFAAWACWGRAEAV